MMKSRFGKQVMVVLVVMLCVVMVAPGQAFAGGLGAKYTPAPYFWVFSRDSTLAVGETTVLSAYYSYSGDMRLVETTDLQYCSSNEGVVTVNSDGKVTAVSAGTATIEVDYLPEPGLRISVSMTVNAPPVGAFMWFENLIYAGDTAHFKVEINDPTILETLQVTLIAPAGTPWTDLTSSLTHVEGNIYKGEWHIPTVAAGGTWDWIPRLTWKDGAGDLRLSEGPCLTFKVPDIVGPPVISAFNPFVSLVGRGETVRFGVNIQAPAGLASINAMLVPPDNASPKLIAVLEKSMDNTWFGEWVIPWDGLNGVWQPRFVCMDTFGNVTVLEPTDRIFVYDIIIDDQAQEGVSGTAPDAADETDEDTTVSGDQKEDFTPAALAQVPVKKVKVGKSAVTLTWKKVASAAQATGYQVQYRAQGAAKWVSKTVSAKSATLTLKNLKKGKRYEVRVRAYRTVAAKDVYGPWGATKKSGKLK